MKPKIWFETPEGALRCGEANSHQFTFTPGPDAVSSCSGTGWTFERSDSGTPHKKSGSRTPSPCAAGTAGADRCPVHPVSFAPVPSSAHLSSDLPSALTLRSPHMRPQTEGSWEGSGWWCPDPQGSSPIILRGEPQGLGSILCSAEAGLTAESGDPLPSAPSTLVLMGCSGFHPFQSGPSPLLWAGGSWAESSVLGRPAQFLLWVWPKQSA